MATEFNIDAGFAYATWALETGYGTSPVWLNQNNPAGIIKLDGSGEYETYSSQEEGLRSMFKLLKHYCDRGNDTVGSIREVWSESEDTSKVITVWKELIERED